MRLVTLSYAAPIAAALLLLPLARAGDDSPKTAETTNLPLNPYAGAKPGQWAVYSRTITSSKDGSSPGHVELQKIEKADAADEDTVVRVATQDGRRPGRQKVGIKDAPTFAAYLGIPEKSHVVLENLKITDEKHSVGGREFACKKISCDFAFAQLKASITFFLCPDVPLGLVSMDLKTTCLGITLEYSDELAGFGTDDKTEWGQSAEDLAKAAKKSAEKGQ
jgi:hypothetical protein